MFAVDRRGELAPRDVVARAVWRQAIAQGGPVLLDATALGRERLTDRFPGLDAACRAAGFDWAIEAVPVTPAAHYGMGGVVTDLDGRTSLPGLFAVGEVARTGVHGANRLASNSLLEAAVFADRAAHALGQSTDAPPTTTPATIGAAIAVVTGFGDSMRHAASGHPAAGASPAIPESGDSARAQPVERAALQALMWQHVGLERDETGLAEASATLSTWRSPAPLDRRSAEDRNLLDLARLTVEAALARRESLGAHFRSDDPVAAARHAEEAA